nr:T9SS type A sorting domain-containing protein [Bacteroidota bacterium]
MTEDNRIQIARSRVGDKMFVSWLDTDTTVSPDNNAPDIWARGVDVVNATLTYNIQTQEDSPQNVTLGSGASSCAYFFAMANEVFYNDLVSYPTYTIPYVYEGMDPNDPLLPVQFKYVQNFFFWEAQFGSAPPPPGIHEVNKTIAEVSEVFPNPSREMATLKFTLNKAANVVVTIANIMGQTVKSLPLRYFNSGSNNVKFDVSDLRAGIYFCAIEVMGEVVTKKIIVG